MNNYCNQKTSQQKTIMVFTPTRIANEAWLPTLWAQAKTYYEKHGKKKDQWHWAPCYADGFGDDFEKIKSLINRVKPDVFAISLYVWNYTIAHKVATWVKEQWPHCLVISGGPHQYFKHDDQWFKKNTHLDVSLPGECFGELCIQEILDNINDNGSLDFNQISDVCYPSPKSKTVMFSKKQMSVKERSSFDFQWSAMSAQLPELRDFISYHNRTISNSKILSILETTRGCPYGCTYCDWGGGINTKVISRNLDLVKQDIDALCQLNLDFVYFSDANFGIFGARDVEIIGYLAQRRKQSLQTFNIGYGGFAKTPNRLKYIKEILKTDVKHNLSILGDIKISMQSLDPEVLHNLDRKNIPLDLQMDTLQNLSYFKRLPLYVELIYGLPGINLDKFYHELDVLGERNLNIQWYPWMLLPEAPAYGRQYREQHNISVTERTRSGWNYNKDVIEEYSEIVVGTSTYTHNDYLEMMISSGTYKLFVQCGLYQNSIQWIKKNHNIGIGDICKDLYQNFFMCSDSTKAFKDYVYNHWHNVILKDSTVSCDIPIPETNESHFVGFYFIGLAFSHYDTFTSPAGDHLHQKWGVPMHVVNQDKKLTITKENFGHKLKKGLFVTDYTKKFFNVENNLNKVILQVIQFKNTGHILRAQSKFLGVLPCK